METAPPDVLDLLKELFEDLQKRFVVYFLGGLGIGMVTLPMVFVGIFLMYGGMFGGMVPGIMMNDEGVMMLGMFGGMFLGLFALIALSVGIMAPMQASLARNMWDFMDGGEDLTLGAPFNRATENLGPTLVYILGHMVVGTFLTMLCYLPGIVWFFLTDLAWCKVVLEGEKPVDAVKWSIGHVQENPSWHVGYFLLLVGMSILLSYLPLIGYFIAPSVTMAWRVYAYGRMMGRPAFNAA